MRVYLTFSKIGILIMAGLFHFSFGKSQTDCSLILERAERMFDQGIIEEIPSLLSGCINHGFSRNQKMHAQKLVILSYQLDGKINEVRDAMADFLNDNPEYQFQPEDPPEFRLLFSDFVTIPFISVGAFIGGNLTSVFLLESYGPYNTITETGQFTSTEPRLQVGIGVNYFLNDRLELNLETIYSSNSFSYYNLQYGFAEISRNERHQRVELPVTLSYDITRNKWNPYFRAGVSYGRLISVFSDFRRANLNNGDLNLNSYESLNVDIIDRRNSGFFNAILGCGIRYKIPKGHLFADLRYFYGLTEMTDPKRRWDQETVFTYYDAESDFAMDYLNFSIGYRYSFYKSSKQY